MSLPPIEERPVLESRPFELGPGSAWSEAFGDASLW